MRKIFCFLQIIAILGGGVMADAQQAAKMFRVGMLRIATPGPLWMEAFQRGLREQGWIEGQNILIIDQWAHGKYDRLPELAAELIRQKVDVIVTAGPQATRAAKQVTNTIPIIMTADFNPIEDGFITSLARPGGNITGLTMLAGELSGKRMELLKEVVSRLSRVAVFSTPENRSHARALDELKAAAVALGVKVQPLDVRAPNEFESAFSTISKLKSQALLVQPDAMFNAQREQIINLAKKNRLPTIFYSSELVEAGGLMSYGVYLPDLYRRAATYVDKVLKGAKAAELPVEQPTKFELVVNLKTAKQIGLTIPRTVLYRADKVIK
jgi:putative ABC transport system substrate-binding protein